jgi:hypothetical protein
MVVEEVSLSELGDSMHSQEGKGEKRSHLK